MDVPGLKGRHHQQRLSAKQYSAFAFPLPPLEVQREVVAEIEGYQRVIDGARAVVDNWQSARLYC